jgi:hypothetical protein
LGLSFESNGSSGDINSGRFADTGNLRSLLQSLGSGVLRFGGTAVDRDYSGVQAAPLASLARLADASGWNVIYSENLGRFVAADVARDAADVTAALGSHLAGIACGNEPNLYPVKGIRPTGYAVPDYLTDADACLSAVHQAAPPAPLVGPDLAPTTWLAPYAVHERGHLALLTEHHYPLTSCGGATASATRLLSRATAAKAAAEITEAAVDARLAEAPLRVTETNSASCSGIPGVSDTFAAALWSVDYILSALEHGATGLDFHGGLSPACVAYTPLCSDTSGHYTARPVYYGILAVHLLGPGRLLPTAANTDRNLAVHAIRAADGSVHVVLENLEATVLHAAVRTGQRDAVARLLMLTAPSLDATTGIAIQGATVAADGSFTPGPATTTACPQGVCTVDLPPYTATLLTVMRR